MDTAALLRSIGLSDVAVLPRGAIPLLPGKTLPVGTTSAIVCLFPYFTGFYPERNLSLYAVGRDYHTVASDMLRAAADELLRHFPGAYFHPYVDASPIDEVAAAAAAGLGDIGQNGLLIAPGWGQFVFVGCLLTDLPADRIGLPARERPSLCTGCGRCVAACPTGALTRDGFLRAACRSEITQKKGALTPEEAGQIRAGGLIWGCDICLMACPHNACPRPAPIPAFGAHVHPVLRADDLDHLGDRAYLWRGKAPLLRNLQIIDG